MDRERMNVYITTSRRHLAYAYVAIYSLFENNADSEVYLYIVSEDLKNEDLSHELKAAEQFGHHIIIIPFDDNMARKYTASSDEKHWPMATMSCYWLFHVLLPEDVDRIMVIESDTVTIGSLYDIYHVDLDGYYMACPGPEHKPDSHINFIEGLGGQCVTFVLSVYNIKEIRKNFSLEQIIETDNRVREKAGHSQMEFTFGILFMDKIKYIPGKESCLDENREYMKKFGWDYIEECEKTCKLIHFSSYEDYSKPWNPVELMPGFYYWWKYAKSGPYFKDYMVQQWERYGASLKRTKELKKNISYRNILLMTLLVFTVLTVGSTVWMTSDVKLGIIIILLLGLSFLMSLFVRWVMSRVS